MTAKETTKKASQDSGGFVEESKDKGEKVGSTKQHKEACNQERLQTKDYLHLSTTAAALDSALTFSLTGSLEIDENKLAEEPGELSNAFAELSMVASDEPADDEKEFCLGAVETDDTEIKEKEDATKRGKIHRFPGIFCRTQL